MPRLKTRAATARRAPPISPGAAATPQQLRARPASAAMAAASPSQHLRGVAFAFHGVTSARQATWTAELQRCGAFLWPLRGTAVRDSGECALPDKVYVLTDYWVDCLPVVARRGVAMATPPRLELVTEFWLRSVMEADAWVAPQAHPFYTPPPQPQGQRPKQQADGDAVHRILYPMEYVDASPADRLHASQPTALGMLLPCSRTNVWNGVPLWPYVFAYLRQPATSSAELTTMLQSTIGDYDRRLNCLERAIDEGLNPSDRETFFTDILPVMQQLVLDLPFHFPTPPRLLTPLATVSDAGVATSTLEFTRVQVLALLSCAFFAACPSQDRRMARGSTTPQADFPWFSMERMFAVASTAPGATTLKAHKIRTILEYFMRVVPRFVREPAALRQEVVTFTRVALQLPASSSAGENESAADAASALLHTLGSCVHVDSTTLAAPTEATPPGPHPSPQPVRMCHVRVETDALIEDLAEHLQIDFANKYAGGGVMNSGCVQEEIRFLLSPELMVACLVFARLDDHEAFVVHGSERFSAYTGYAHTYRFAGSFRDETASIQLAPAASSRGAAAKRRRASVVVGIDALSYGGGAAAARRQYSRRCVVRDLVKALVGFAYPEPTSSVWPVATGNWGCGVFNGDPELKFVIQWLAASLVRRPAMVYVVFEQSGSLKDKMEALLRVTARVAATESGSGSVQLARLLLEFLLSLGDTRGAIAATAQRAEAKPPSAGPRRRATRTMASAPAAMGSASVLAQAIEFLTRRLGPAPRSQAAGSTTTTVAKSKARGPGKSSSLQQTQLSAFWATKGSA